MEKEPPIFKAFIQVFEAEKNLSESGTKHLADSLGFLTVEIKSIDWEVSAQVLAKKSKCIANDELLVGGSNSVQDGLPSTLKIT